MNGISMRFHSVVTWNLCICVSFQAVWTVMNSHVVGLSALTQHEKTYSLSLSMNSLGPVYEWQSSASTMVVAYMHPAGASSFSASSSGVPCPNQSCEKNPSPPS